MTTLDDAAERKIRELAETIGRQVGNAYGMSPPDGSEPAPNSLIDGLRSIARTAWTEATEAAAKKCDAFAEPRLYQAKWAAERCAEIIRGKGG